MPIRTGGLPALTENHGQSSASPTVDYVSFSRRPERSLHCVGCENHSVREHQSCHLGIAAYRIRLGGLGVLPMYVLPVHEVSQMNRLKERVHTQSHEGFECSSRGSMRRMPETCGSRAKTSLLEAFC